MIVVVTGHRPKTLNNIYDLKDQLYINIGFKIRNLLLEKLQNLKEDEKLELVTGMALGIDTVFALVGLKLKREYGDKVRIHCVLPCNGQESRWRSIDKERYCNILKKADTVKYVSNKAYADKTTMLKRDEYMVDLISKSSQEGMLLSVWNEVKSGGTWYTVNYANRNNINHINIHPYK